MNELIRFIWWLNVKAFRIVKRGLYMCSGYIERQKVKKMMKEFENSERYDVNYNFIPRIDFSDYPTILDLTRYLRNEFGAALPDRIVVYHQGDENSDYLPYRILLKLIAVGDDEIDAKNVISINNGFCKYYSYHETFSPDITED